VSNDSSEASEDDGWASYEAFDLGGWQPD